MATSATLNLADKGQSLVVLAETSNQSSVPSLIETSGCEILSSSASSSPLSWQEPTDKTLQEQKEEEENFFVNFDFDNFDLIDPSSLNSLFLQETVNSSALESCSLTQTPSPSSPPAITNALLALEPNLNFDKENFPSLRDVVLNQEKISLKLDLGHLSKKQKLIDGTSSSAVSLLQTPIPVSNNTPNPLFVSSELLNSLPSQSVVMEKFPPYQIVDFKHVIYNLLVDQHNNPDVPSFIVPIRIEGTDGTVRTGFRFETNQDPEKNLAKLYAKFVRKVDLERENLHSIVAQDLCKYYFRSTLELLAKYFEKKDKLTFLDQDVPLFIAGGSLDEADLRLRNIKVRSRKRKFESDD